MLLNQPLIVKKTKTKTKKRIGKKHYFELLAWHGSYVITKGTAINKV